MATWELLGEVGKIESHMKNWREAIPLLLIAWPEQARIADFKEQTPLMLVADNSNVALVEQFLAAGSDVDAQDCFGRTALHSAVTGRSPECVSAVLQANPCPRKVTTGEENSALHTAVRFGLPKTVALIRDRFPELAMQTNAAGQTLHQMAHEILDNLPDFESFMREKGRSTGAMDDFDVIVALLAEEGTVH